MSNLVNDGLLSEAAEVLWSNPPKEVKSIIERCLDNDDLEGLRFVLAHLPEIEEKL